MKTKISYFIKRAKKLIEINLFAVLKYSFIVILDMLKMLGAFAVMSAIIGWIACTLSRSIFEKDLSFPVVNGGFVSTGAVILIILVLAFFIVLFIRDFIYYANKERGKIQESK